MSELPLEAAKEAADRQVVDGALDLIMPFSEYRTREHPTPYVFELRKGDRQLVFFGTAHSMDGTDPLFDDIKDRMTRFASEVQNPEVFYEGDAWYEGKLTDEQARGQGEAVYTQWLAEQRGIPTESPEPPEHAEIDAALERGFERDEVAAWYLARTLRSNLIDARTDITYKNFGGMLVKTEVVVQPQWAQNMPSRDELLHLWKTDRQRIEQYLEEIGRQVLPKFIETFERINGASPLKQGGSESTKDIIAFDPEIIEQYSDPADFSNVHGKTNAIAAISSRTRDAAIVRKIGAAIAAGKNVFVVYGASHAVMQESALRKIFDGVV